MLTSYSHGPYQETSLGWYFHSPATFTCFWCHLQYRRNLSKIRFTHFPNFLQNSYLFSIRSLPFSERNFGQ